MIYAAYLVHVVVSLFLILVVLLQQGKGADLSVFGGGTSQAAFGARGTATVLHKLTVICFVLFIITTLSIGILQSRARPTVMSGMDSEQSEPAEADGGLVDPAPAAGSAVEGAPASTVESSAGAVEAGGAAPAEEGASGGTAEQVPPSQ